MTEAALGQRTTISARSPGEASGESRPILLLSFMTLDSLSSECARVIALDCSSGGLVHCASDAVIHFGMECASLNR